MNAPADRPLVATYRLQLTPTFGFAQATGLIESIASLGASHLYLSPVAEAMAGSSHGYDVVDHRRVRTEFGGEAGLFDLLDAAGAAGLGVIIDHVPNHASVERPDLNPSWWEMLRGGPESPAAAWFDVDWEYAGGKVIIPQLGAPVAELVERGELTVAAGDDGHEIRYGPLRYPMAAGTEDLPIDEALAAQHFELEWWRSPRRNVRRFFTIDNLVALCVEHDDVAAAVDTIPRLLAEHEAFAGVRVDHVDGLADPEGYLRALRSVIGDRWLVVEKILAPDETLPTSWPVAGTTGYEQVTAAEHTLLDPSGLDPLDGLWRELAAESGQPHEFHALEATARREVLDGGLRPDLDRLVRAVRRDRGPSDEDLRTGFVELTLALDRYRTYLPDPESVAVLDTAEQVALGRTPQHAAAIAAVASLVRTDDVVRTRWQQLTGPVMAKGAEDRAFYRHQRLSSMCEVGGSPGTWTLDVADFHNHQQRVQSGWPTTMLTATTHDTKRSAAVRARSLALVTRADEWSDLVRAWISEHDLGSLHTTDVSLALQTVVAAWPLDADRLHQYLVKASREADLVTSWTEPDDTYEAALHSLATTLVDEAGDERTPLARMASDVVGPGSSIGLRLLALQLTCPGVPDLYQGAPRELLSLVDPDNRRRPGWSAWGDLVDDALARNAPIDLDEPDLARTRFVGRVFAARREHAAAFGPRAGYVPLESDGPDARRVIAFARADPDGVPAVTTVAVRPGASDLDASVAVPGARWHDLVHDVEVAAGSIDVAALTGDDGVAVLRRS
ncbi:MAG: malto-oligosyltrehalose synthase [Ilumatobacteraceae bacterium]|nr:malto-oligosyltrehalose synthase [Ilumatobacteraceae bacterium]